MMLTTALEYDRPGEEWTLDGEEYSGLTWLSDTTKPTEKELEAAYPLAVAEKEKAEAKRAAAVEAYRDHAASLGFTDEMLAVMYPTLIEEQ